MEASDYSESADVSGEKDSEDFRKNDKEPDEDRVHRCEKQFSFSTGVYVLQHVVSEDSVINPKTDGRPRTFAGKMAFIQSDKQISNHEQ